MIWRKFGPIILCLAGIILHAIFYDFRAETSVNYADTPHTYSYEELISLGKQSYTHMEFIDKIRRDMNNHSDIKLILGDYRFKIDKTGVVSLGRLIRLPNLPNSIFILIDKSFFENISSIEQKAIIAHELGHLIYTTNSLRDQIGADLIAVGYTSPEAVINFLNKIYEGREDSYYKARIARIANMLAKEQNLN